MPNTDPSPLLVRISMEAACATLSALTVAPAISIIDKAIVSNASGREALLPCVMNGVKSFVLNPLYFFKQPAFLMIWGVYSGTYIVANSVEAICERRKQSSYVPKFIASSGTNVSLSVLKDQAYAKLFGQGPPKPMAWTSMSLFAIRDSATILASFCLPGQISHMIQKYDGSVSPLAADTFAQLATPVSMQILSTPLHLYGLDIYNRPEALSIQDRKQFIQSEYLKTTIARMSRIFPAYGIGGVVNKYIRKVGFKKIKEHYGSSGSNHSLTMK